MDLPFVFLLWINAIYILGLIKKIFLLGGSAYYFRFRGWFLESQGWSPRRLGGV